MLLDASTSPPMLISLIATITSGCGPYARSEPADEIVKLQERMRFAGARVQSRVPGGTEGRRLNSRGVILRGATWAELWLHAVVLWAMAIGMIGYSTLMFRKRVA